MACFEITFLESFYHFGVTVIALGFKNLLFLRLLTIIQKFALKIHIKNIFYRNNI